MSSPRTYRVEAVVLKGFDYGEADRILTVYSAQHGKLRVVAKGVRRIKSRMAGHLDLFTRSTFLVHHGRQLDIVTQAETLENFAGMRCDLWRSTFAHYIAELVDGFAAESLANYPLYALTVATFRRIAEYSNLDVVVRSFELQALSLTGYRPQLYRCLNCDQSIQPQINRFSVKLGGVLCPDCASADIASKPVSVDALKIMRNLQTKESLVLQLPALPQDIQREIERHLQEYIVYRLEHIPRSTGFVERLRTQGFG